MAVRDLVDANGVSWKVWPVTPESLQPRTAAEDYLGEYGEGWLCFESSTERRRLARYPADWDSLSTEQLCALLERAAVVQPRKPKRSTPPPNEPRHP